MAKKRCTECGTNPVIGGPAGDIQADLCEDCFDFAGWENQHSDEGHSADNIDPNCPICTEQTPSRETTTPRSHTSHASCDHPRTKSARAKCRRTRSS